MLPAKLRGLASRVGRLALNSFTAHKNHQTDGVREHQCANSTASVASASASADSNHHSAYAQTVSVDARAARQDRTFRTSRTFRRTLFAMLVAVATLLAMLVVPAKPANAAQVWWDYAGNGYMSHDSVAVGDVIRDMSIGYPDIAKVNVNGEDRIKVTWDVYFNTNSIGGRRVGKPSLGQFGKGEHGNQPSLGTGYDKPSWFYAWIPKEIEDSSITVAKSIAKRSIEAGVVSFDWPDKPDEVLNRNTWPSRVASRKTWYYTDRDFEVSWNDSLAVGSNNHGLGGRPTNPDSIYHYKNIEGNGATTYEYNMCEVRAWKDRGGFGRVFSSQEYRNEEFPRRWVISGYLNKGLTEYDAMMLPFIAGWTSAKGTGKNKYSVMGPFDTDGDGIPDFVEHQYHMNPRNNDDISYPAYEENMLKDYGKYNVPITTYSKPITLYPSIKEGDWQGDSSDGHFAYSGKTSTNVPQHIGITYNLKNVPKGVRIVNSPSNMQEGTVYINNQTGQITYNPRKEDRDRTLDFGTEIVYPDPSKRPYNCNYKTPLRRLHPTKIKVVSQASLYNPVYTPVDLTEKTGENQRDVIPIVYTAKPQSVKDPSKKNYSFIQAGDLPQDATFEIKQYTKKSGRSTLNSDPALDWSRIENQDKNNGQVRFYSNKWREPGESGKFRTPVIVHYADGSSSTDDDAGNADKNGNFANSVVYASVNLKRPNPKDSELKLNIHKGYGGSNLGDNGSVTITVNDTLKPSVWIDSWAQYQIGQISLKSLCWKETTQKGGKVEKSGYTFSDLSKKDNANTINGLTFKQTEKWPHASDKEQETCFANGTCGGKKLFDKDAFTIERSRGEISGTPKKGGKYVCRVFALRDGSKAKTDFDTAVKDNNYNFSLPSGSQRYDWQSKTVNFVAHSLAHKYNPQYVKVNVKAGHKGGVTSDAPVSQRGANGVKGDDKSQNDLVPNGTRLPKGTWFELKKYSSHKNSEGKLSWSSFEGKQSNKKSKENKPEDSTSDEMYGKVTFAPNNGILTGKYSTPVIVHYPDGSTSEDPDSGNLGKPVYAPVEVTDQDIQDDDLKLKVYSQYGGRRIDDDDKNGMRFRKGDTLGDKSSDTYKPMFFDSWSSAKPGKIYQRMLCYKLGAGNKRSGYKIDGINGLTLAGRKGNTTSGEFSDKQPSQWTRATEKQKNECKKNKNNCKPNLYLYGDEHDTVERTWGWLHGKVEENGDFVCTVYAIKDLENKDGKHGNLQNKFDTELNKFVKNPGDRKFEEVIKTVLKDQKSSKDNPLDGTKRHIDWDSVTFPIHVHPDAHYYNPKYEEVTKLQAGETGTSKLPKSVRSANGAKNNQDAVKDNEPLPDGTWFEFKQYTKDKKPNGAEPLNYAFFENDDDNVKNEGGKKSAKNDTGQFGNVTFHPHRWINANRSDNAPVVVHYPDGSTSEDPDSGNNGNPVYAKVNVVPHDFKPGDLSFDVTNNFNSGGWKDKIIKIKKGDPLTNNHPRRLNLWSTHKPGKIELRTICHKIIHKNNTADTTSEYTWNGIAGITMENPSIWDHQEDPQKQHKCYGDKSQCDASKLYDDYVINGNSRNTTERTRASLSGKANKSGDYECVVYAIKQGSKLLESFDKAVKSIKPDKSGKATPSDTDPLKDFKWKLDGDNGKKDAVAGVDYATRTIQIQIHNDNHFYNPKYLDVSVKAGQKVENAVPQSVKSANGADKYQDAVKAGALPDGTWFEFKDAANGFEVNADGTAGNKVSLDWSYWASNNAADKTGEQSNKPDDPSKQKNGKHSAKDDGTRYGKVTFHPDQSVTPKAYFKEIVIHYPDGSTSDDTDSGNNGKPVYAKVTVSGLGSGSDKDLKMTLLRSQDADSTDTLGGGHSLTVMSGTSLTKNPYVRAWSLKDRSNISLRMMCTKQGEENWSRGLDDTLNMQLNQDYGNGVQPWAFASADQRKSCSQDSKNCMANLLYGFTKNGKQDSIESAVSRSEDDIIGVPQKAGNYTCAVFALKPNALTVFNGLSSSTDMKKVQLTGLSPAVDWNRISFDVNVIDPPKFALPKTGGEGMSMALLVVAMIGMCVMCGAFFVDQTKWGHAMLAGAAAGMMGGLRGIARGMTASLTQSHAMQARTTQANIAQNSNSKISEIWRSLVKKVKDIRRFDEYSASVKDFVRKATGWLRAAFRRVRRWATERWRC